MSAVSVARGDGFLASLRRVLLWGGGALLAVWTIATLESSAYQAFGSWWIKIALGQSVSRRSTEPDGVRTGAAALARPFTGKIVGRIEIPRVHVGAVVASGIDDETLGRAVGHVASTARPGEPGNVVLAGHRDTFFRGLRDIREGDDIAFVTTDSVYDYVVESFQVVEPECTAVMRPTPFPTLTLVTCYPFAYVGRAPQRFIVTARQVEWIDGPDYSAAGTSSSSPSGSDASPAPAGAASADWLVPSSYSRNRL